MKNIATLKFKNFTARPRSFWVRTKLTRAGEALCCAHPAEAVCLEISSAVAKPSRVGKNFKILNFKSQNATGAYYDADRDIHLSADRDINSGRNLATNFKISNANLKTNLAVLKVDLRTDFKL
ncbi:hypothetical protein [uncultured Campylobacter sp.]|uniref:hypothetical protein n=1 Tax=uncultured Campylobacter sp. TaxID=218934 RepID=UPI00262431C1|nr:hypothetical protein [uncultured Campylobacter sp.]